MADMVYDLEKEEIERDYLYETNAAKKEFEDKKEQLKSNLIVEAEEKKKLIEQERYSLDLLSDSMEVCIFPWGYWSCNLCSHLLSSSLYCVY